VASRSAVPREPPRSARRSALYGCRLELPRESCKLGVVGLELGKELRPLRGLPELACFALIARQREQDVAVVRMPRQRSLERLRRCGGLAGVVQRDAVHVSEARVAGHDLRRANSQAKLQLGYMAQKFSLYGLLSVRQNLAFSAGVYGLAGSLARQRIGEMVETFQLDRYLDHPPDELPLGFKQRLALACALMHRPPVLFLDEPTSGVDPVTRREFWSHINGLVRKGVTVLVTTHFMDEAEYCDRVALMYHARVIALDTPDALKARVASTSDQAPSMEDAFVELIRQVDAEHSPSAAAGAA